MSQKGLKYAIFSYSFLEIFCFYQLYFETTVAQTRLWEIVIQQFENVSADFSFTVSHTAIPPEITLPNISHTISLHSHCLDLDPRSFSGLISERTCTFFILYNILSNI